MPGTRPAFGLYIMNMSGFLDQDPGRVKEGVVGLQMNIPTTGGRTP